MIPVFSSTITNNEIQRHVEEIFQDGAYHRTLQSYQPSESVLALIKKMWETVISWLHGISDKLNELHFNSPVLFWLIFAGLVLILVLLLLHMAWSIRIAFSSRRSDSSFRAESAIETQGAKFTLKQAEELASQHRYTEAVRVLFLVLLERLADTHQAAGRRSWTNHQIVNTVNVPDSLRGELHAAAAAFDRGWYGQSELAADLYHASHSTITALLASLPSFTGRHVEERSSHGSS